MLWNQCLSLYCRQANRWRGMHSKAVARHEGKTLAVMWIVVSWFQWGFHKTTESAESLTSPLSTVYWAVNAQRGFSPPCACAFSQTCLFLDMPVWTNEQLTEVNSGRKDTNETSKLCLNHTHPFRTVWLEGIWQCASTKARSTQSPQVLLHQHSFLPVHTLTFKVNSRLILVMKCSNWHIINECIGSEDGQQGLTKHLPWQIWDFIWEFIHLMKMREGIIHSLITFLMKWYWNLLKQGLKTTIWQQTHLTVTQTY